MKKLLYLCGLLLVACSLIGCTSKGESQNTQIENQFKLDVTETIYTIADKAGFETSYLADESYLEKTFEWDVKKGPQVIGLFGSVLDTDRILLFQAKTKEEKAYVMEFITHFQTKMVEQYPEVMTEEKEMIERALILDQGEYILFITGENAQDGANYFDELS